MAIRVEFYGIARVRAGIAATSVHLDGAPTLGQLFAALRAELPDFARSCFEQDRLQATFVANVDGERFVRDPQTPLTANGTVLILSTDAGG